ncbi:hypothetical protein BCV69DRAFT_284035 [Microstroma glucosiphilum]|uniref:Exosome complex protein n=1 Tax=Pseudomicrostroma glucosiphilum TaxID=1684307 RepID=A0A316U217_9BASI|nr:hypothetical protein BCV69DRAFT_284035 [Pseudomicrostroma glucosiphilum]PWN19402.1 hypothetical protein BCV69DRAFT_284035 [Pseudomicrostroma glucosiphilum]
MSLESPLPALAAFSESLATLGQTLDPLLKQPLDQIVSKLEEGSSHTAESSSNGLEGRLDAAKLQVSIAYVLLDLVWFQLKVQGQDPSAHPVHAELERVRTYFGKIKFVQSGASSASSSTSSGAPTLPGQEGRLRVDQAAAGRFIRSGLGAAGEKGKHTKFDEAEKKEEAAAEAVASGSASSSSSSSSDSSDSEGDSGAEAPAELSTKKDKKGRIIRDPFEGYDSPKRTKSKQDAPTSSAKKRKASTEAAAIPEAAAASPSSHPASKKARKRSGKGSKQKKH